MSKPISIRAYARRIGRSPKAVRKHIERGVIEKTANGQVDPEQADAALRSKGLEVPSTDGDPQGTGYPAESPEPVVAGPGAASKGVAEPSEAGSGLRSLLDNIELLSKAEAEQVKENYLALQRRLEYERAAGEVVPVDEAAQRVAEEYASVRSKLLALPTELAPTIAQETGGDANKIRDRLAEGITRALEELSDDGGDGS